MFIEYHSFYLCVNRLIRSHFLLSFSSFYSAKHNKRICKTREGKLITSLISISPLAYAFRGGAEKFCTDPIVGARRKGILMLHIIQAHCFPLDFVNFAKAYESNGVAIKHGCHSKLTPDMLALIHTQKKQNDGKKAWIWGWKQETQCHDLNF